jgi:multisubunit Na+/H+ antiporter MnhG subunit
VKKINSGYLFLFSFLTVFIITPLFQQGVFGDGLMYLTVAFNRYKEYGSFWQQRYSETSMSFFCEQPPLYFESLGWFYKFFGGAEVAEKLFTLVLLCASVFLIAAIWNKLTTKKFHRLSWFPSFLLVLVPIFTWAFSNQVIETMVVPLSLLAFYLNLVFIQSENKTKKIAAFFGIVLLLFFLLLTKGVQSVFLLGALFLAGITNEKKSKKNMLLQNVLLLILFSGICALVFWGNAKAHFWLESYYQKRLVATFNHVGATADYHAQIIVRYFSELLPVFILLFVVSLYFKVKNNYSFSLQWKNFKSNKTALWLLLISLSASLPMALTLEQRGFYLSPAFPFAALGLGLLYKKYFFVMLGRIFSKREKIVAIVASVFVAVALVFFVQFKNEYKRDEGMIKDVALLKKIIPAGQIVGIDASMWNTFSLHSYLNMANNNSLAVSDTCKFFLLDKENKAAPPANYIKQNLTTFWLDVYVREKR